MLFDALTPVPTDPDQVPMFAGLTPRPVALAIPPHVGHAVAKCPACGAGATVDLHDGGCAPVACPDCGARMKVQTIRATLTEGVCDSRCMGALGPDCQCSCGGVNHGRSHRRL